jgi:hypothetical protein
LKNETSNDLDFFSRPAWVPTAEAYPAAGNEFKLPRLGASGGSLHQLDLIAHERKISFIDWKSWR